METATRCACGSAATANGRECPACFRRRLRSIRLDTSVIESRTLKRYWDDDALDQTFGEDRVDSYWEETAGHGAIHRVGDKLMHRNHRGEVLEATDEVLEHFVGGEAAEDVV